MLSSTSSTLFLVFLNSTIWLIIFISASLVYICWTCYHALFTPLSSIPGPPLAKYSNFWRVKNSASGHAPLNFQDLHNRYGTVVRVGPNGVSVSDPAQIPVIYGISSKFVKSRFYELFTPAIGGKIFPSIFSHADQDAHRRLKSGIAQKYSLSSLLSLEPLVDRVTEQFMSKLRERIAASGDNTLDLGAWLQYYAFDVIGSITFSKTFGFIESGNDPRDVIGGLEFGLKYGAVVGQVPTAHKFLLGSPVIKGTVGKHPTVAAGDPIPKVYKMILESLDSSAIKVKIPGCEDFATFMKKQNDKDPSKMTDDMMINHMFVNLLAGSDTTAISLRTVFYHLMRNPRIYARLQAEIDAADTAELLSPIITYSEAQAHIPYLALVVKEALRVHPAVSLPLERIVPAGGIPINGYFIPEGTVIGINAWTVHYDKSVFGDDANDFRPERWENDGSDASKERLRVMERSFFAFGHGSRSCIGKNISLMEMGKFVPQFLREFEIEWAGGQTWTVESSWFAKQSGIVVRYKSKK